MISITTEGGPRPARDWDAMNQEEKARIERKLDEILEMMWSRNASPSTTPAAPTSAAAPALGVGGPSSGPGSSTTSGASPAVPDAKLVFAIDTTSLGAPLPTRCSTECPSSDASALVTLEDIPLTDTTPLDVTATELIALGLGATPATTALLDHVILTEVIPYNRQVVRSVSGLSNIGHLSGLQLKPPWPSWIGSGEHLQLPMVTEEVTAVGGLPQEDFPGDGVDMHQLAKFLFKQNYIGEQTKLQDILVQVSITNLAMQLINYHADYDAQIGMETSSVFRELYVINLDDIASFAVQMSSSDVEKLKCLSRDFQYLLRFNIGAHLSLFPWNPGGCLSGYSSRGLKFPCSYSVEESSHAILGIVQIQGMMMSMGMELTVLYHLAQLLMSWFLGVLIECSTMGLQFSVCIDIWVSSPLDPGQAADDHKYIVEPYFTKITYSQAIADVCRKQKTLQSLQVKCSSCPRFLQFEKMHDVMGALLESNSWPYWQSYSLDPIMRAPPGMHGLELNSCDFWVDILLPLLLVLAPDGIIYFQGIFDYSHNKRLFDRKSDIFGWLQLVTKALSYSTSKNNQAYYAAPLTCSLGISCLGIGSCVDLPFTCTAAVYSEYGNRFRQAFSVDILPGQYHGQIAWHSQISEVGIPVMTTGISGLSVVLVDNTNAHGRSPWDPGGCRLAWYSCDNWWNTSKPTALHCSDQLRWLSVLLAYASEIWLVAWAGYDLEPSSGCGQALSQEGRDVLNQAIISDSARVGHHYYIAFVNKIVVGYDCSCNQVYSFDTICNDLIYYREDNHRYAGNIKEVHAPWDPGKSALCSPPKTSAWGQAEFQEGRNVMTLAYLPQAGPLSWTGDRFGPTDPPRASFTSTYSHQEASSNPSRWITNLNGVSSSPDEYVMFYIIT